MLPSANSKKVKKKMGKPNDKLREQLAEYAHVAWAGWMQFMFACGHNDRYGDFVIPEDKAARWTRQMTTKYSDLPENEKPSDREQADRILAIVYPPEVRAVIEAAKKHCYTRAYFIELAATVRALKESEAKKDE